MGLTKTTEVSLETFELVCVLLGKPHKIFLEDGVYEQPRHD
jgi:hypothetical protein